MSASWIEVAEVRSVCVGDDGTTLDVWLRTSDWALVAVALDMG